LGLPENKNRKTSCLNLNAPTYRYPERIPFLIGRVASIARERAIGAEGRTQKKNHHGIE
jgi:hypothetical protein